MDSAVLAWSGGKDAAYALYEMCESAEIQIIDLLTTINKEHDRSTMHGVRRHLYERQAEALELPLNTVMLPPEPSNAEYETVMAEEFQRYHERDIQQMVFGDIFLEEVRSYREDQLAETEIEGYWPLWGRDTTTLIRDFLDSGFKSTVVAVDGEMLDASYAGRELNEQFLNDLPSGVDPCGENGEFHTFVRDGPIFTTPVPVEQTGTVTRTVGDTDFHYADIQPLSD